MTAARRLAPILFVLGCRSALPVPELRDASPDGPLPEPLPPTIGPITLPDDQGGSRLRAVWLHPEDGASAPTGAIRDTLLDASCRWELYEGGTYRCLPAYRRITAYYADAHCTQPLLVDSGPAPSPPDYVRAVPAQLSCPSSTVLRRRGARVQPSEVFGWRAQGCVRQSMIAGDSFYELGELVPASAFAGATRRIEPVAEGWSRVYLEGDDGSRWASSLRRGEVDCRITTAADGVLRCLPVTQWSIPFGLEGPDAHAKAFLVEADCTSPVAWGQRSSCAAEAVLLSDDRPARCTRPTSIRRATRRLDVAYSGVSCEPSIDPTVEAFGVGAELPPSDFSEATRGLLEGPGRLKRYATQTPAGVHGISSWWDSQFGAPCSFVADGDADLCVPYVTFPPRVLFADASCKRRIVAADPCRPVRFVAEPLSDPPQARIFRLGPEIPVAAPHGLDGDRCVSTVVSPGTIFHELGPEAPLGDFVRISVSR